MMIKRYRYTFKYMYVGFDPFCSAQWETLRQLVAADNQSYWPALGKQAHFWVTGKSSEQARNCGKGQHCLLPPGNSKSPARQELTLCPSGPMSFLPMSNRNCHNVTSIKKIVNITITFYIASFASVYSTVMFYSF